MYYRILAPLLIISLTSQANALPQNKKQSELETIQILRHSENLNQEIANPRDITLTNNRTLLIASGDSNSLSVFGENRDNQFSYLQSFSSSKYPTLALEGASDVTYIEQNDVAIVSSFYSGSLTSFKRNQNGLFEHVQTLGNDINIKQAFSDYEKVKHKDTLSLLGAWSTHFSHQSNTLYVASYLSNAVSIFDIEHTGALSPHGQLLPKTNWGRPTSISQPSDENWLYINGFEDNKVSILKKDADGKYALIQTLTHGSENIETMQNPQQILISPDNQFLFVAASKSNNINVFKKSNSDTFLHHQTLSSPTPTSLSGACCIAFSSKQNMLFAAGESGEGILVYGLSPSSGKLSLKRHIKQIKNNKINGVSVLSLSSDERTLYAGTGKNNEVFIIKL
ncbi:beta-propeller fold lactonase family protein [Pseudoalteromonas luteoviolacea]|uniref:lactonase family protein n=1 Tax=Pseudoalteromonas luteoviolacea TaxID=43657 RepID=UPI001F197C6D|nr:beta-propeller fold lactonase family protein [Pseudoalteromonas luteoviolacea]MCF6439500.1 beta-propeller fold lactonase family protein [Pseudoalteromonas luteoviolacea]